MLNPEITVKYLVIPNTTHILGLQFDERPWAFDEWKCSLPGSKWILGFQVVRVL